MTRAQKLARQRLYNSRRDRANALRVRREGHLRRKYGITLDDLRRMDEEQQGRCAICSAREKLVVDHDHKSGKVRALLCARCNLAIGLFDENPDKLRAAVEYIVGPRRGTPPLESDL